MNSIQTMLGASLHILELPQENGGFFLEPRNYNDLMEALGKFKKLVKKQRKKLARKYHPDMPKGDEEKMKQINDAVDFVMGLKPMRIRRPVPVFSFSFNTSTTATSSTFHSWFDI